MKIVAVGFKVSQENSVYYEKSETIKTNFTSKDSIEETMGKMLYRAWVKGSEFVSVRFI